MSSLSKGAVAVVTAFTLTAATTAAASAAPKQDTVQRELDTLVGADFPGALASAQGRDGKVRNYVAGVGDLKTGAKVPVDGRVRIGSNTKPYVAVVVMQLVGESRIDLDATVETYLPGLIRRNGNDGRKITVRQLLNHTSGLPNYTRWIKPITELRDVYLSPRDLLDLGLSHKRAFAPGEKWEYSNTGYVVLGLLVEKVTGRPIHEEVTNRIIKPLGLHDTYWPGLGERGIRGRHPRGYHFAKPGADPIDVTSLDPSWGWAAGQLIATPSDLNRFYRALLDGALVKPAQLTEMKKTVKPEGFVPGWTYGLGIVKIPLSCGGTAWGHGGDIDGYETRNGATEDGRAVTLAVTALPTSEKAVMRPIEALDRTICAQN
ncbi:serine hydrolase domain-containing protein [Herbidospora mongoliensis]|uniref:serine hydrolase domain-containing protein n=1 Tax=Herbidospora mongoliensis TaxID=688067 RepID=UPI0008320D8C|nr:serine hydrolase domain-containing protein [Herbidospora mongoliensis]